MLLQFMPLGAVISGQALGQTPEGFTFIGGLLLGIFLERYLPRVRR